MNTLSDKRREAGSKGGQETVKRYGRHYMQRLGQWGAHRTHAIYRLDPVDLNDFAMVNRETGEIKAYLSGKPLNKS
jgi:hypothetical protein